MRVSAAPDIATERLVLRAHRPDDLDACAAMWGDPRVVEHIGGRAFSREEVWQRLLRYAGSWPMLGFGFWIVCAADDGRFIGEAGFLNGQRTIEPPLGDDPETGWALAADAQGHGYAREALTAILDWADMVLEAPRTTCLIAPQNARSIALAARCGFRHLAAGTYRGEPALILERRPLVPPGERAAR